jgi:hypothetical protein
MALRVWLVGATVLVLVAGCKSEPKGPAKGTAPAPAAAAVDAAAPAPSPAVPVPAPAGGLAAKPATPPAAEAPATPPAEGGQPALDRDKLSKAYQEVYCAQKKGEMDKILGIYKAYGFNTPQEFTKTWIEAAKDTDWVTKIAHEVSKGCK